MGQYFELHPVNPQARLVKQAVDMIRDGGVAPFFRLEEGFLFGSTPFRYIFFLLVLTHNTLLKNGILGLKKSFSLFN